VKLTKKNYKLWCKATKIIPGGNALISKRPQFFLPSFWPTYYSKSKGCNIWDLDNNKLYDFSLMGVGTNILGYSYSKIDNQIKKVINKGVMSTLNCYEEIRLSENLLKINKWADMVKFARSGGEANAIAVRIARATTDRHHIAICGYHGWHDWYLAANVKKKNNLSKLLLKGLLTEGVPNELKNSVHTFMYNDFEYLKNLVNTNPKIGIIKMEVERNQKPKNEFLRKIRNLCTKKNIILIFDECTSGFRETFGGLHQKYNINPDIAIFGKALGNGYAITSVVGKKEIMENTKNTFISSTFWSERIGFTAGLYTLKFMKENKSWSYISLIGKFIKSEWKKIFIKYNFIVEISGLESIPTYNFKHNHNERVTFITQEMLKKKILSNNTIFVSLAHKKLNVKKYLECFEEVIEKLYNIEKNGTKLSSKILGPIKADTFQRLN
jgi:glutamate-1-semialdehyde aminotransferase